MMRVLLSGGIDSAVCLAWARATGSPVEAVFFSYGQPARKQEYSAVVRLCRHFGVNHWSIPLELEGASGLSEEGEKVVVPGRNEAFLRTAAKGFPPPESLIIGACFDDAELFADCRPDFLNGLDDDLEPDVVAPLLYLTKRQVWDYSKVYGGTMLLEMTWSCYLGGETHCGTCLGCQGRDDAFDAHNRGAYEKVPAWFPAAWDLAE